MAQLLSPGAVVVMSIVAGYILQALGLGLFYYVIKLCPGAVKFTVYTALTVNMVTMVPAVLSGYAVGTIIFGSLMNVACGVIAGYYLYVMTWALPVDRKASAFGLGYGLSILAAWLISLIGGGVLYYSEYVLITCAVLTLLAVAMISMTPEETDNDKTPSAAPVQPDRSTLLYTAVLIFLFGLVNSSSFSFPSQIVGSINVELSRLLYAAGLMISGFVTDKNRRYGAVSSLAVLVIPFILLALHGEPLPATLFWALGYFAFGFYSVFRVILFSDIAWEKGMLQLSVSGLLIGRIGEAAGKGIFLVLEDQLTIMIILTAFLFVVTVIVFFMVYHRRYMTGPEQASEQERFEHFTAKHDLSSREREVLQLILKEKTNAEIAQVLCISENTVKFHVRNLLQKTGCKNRKELHSFYHLSEKL